MQACSDCLAYEFRPDSIGLNHDNPSDFVKSQWPVNQKLYVVYRIIVALGFIGWIVADLLYESNAFYKDRPWAWFVFATNWSFLLLGLSAIYQAICTTVYTVKSGGTLDRQTFERMPPSLKLLWGLQNLGYNSVIVVTISYWSFIAFLNDSTFLMTEMSKLKHTLGTVYVIVDVMSSATPFRILHMLFTIGLGSVYSLFNAIYFLNDGTILDGRHYAYNVLNWSNPSEAIVTCLLCILQTTLSQIILYELYKIRSWLFTRLYFETESMADSEMQSIITDSPDYMTYEEKQQDGSVK